MISPEKYISFGGQDWAALKAWLLEKKETKIKMLVAADTHDKSNQIRGALSFIMELLALEAAADMAAQRNANDGTTY